MVAAVWFVGALILLIWCGTWVLQIALWALGIVFRILVLAVAAILGLACILWCLFTDPQALKSGNLRRDRAPSSS